MSQRNIQSAVFVVKPSEQQEAALEAGLVGEILLIAMHVLF